MSVYVEKLAEFSAMLRGEGLAVGTQETADACEILTVLDMRFFSGASTAFLSARSSGMRSGGSRRRRPVSWPNAARRRSGKCR